MFRHSSILLIGATGNAGHRIAATLADQRTPLILAGRDERRLETLAQRIGATDITVGELSSLATAVHPDTIVVNAAGPFTGTATPIVEAALAQGAVYVDIANELPALQCLWELADRAKGAGSTLIGGAGFGPTVSEAMLSSMREADTRSVSRVRVVNAPSSDSVSPGVQATVATSIARGTAWFEDGRLHTAPFGTGSTTVVLSHRSWTVVPAPTADVLTAQRLTSAPDVTSYFAAPDNRDGTDASSRVYAELTFDDGSTQGAVATLGPGADVSAAITAETVRRLLNAGADRRAGAWTPVALFGPTVLTAATAVEFVEVDPADVWTGDHTAVRSAPTTRS